MSTETNKLPNAELRPSPSNRLSWRKFLIFCSIPVLSLIATAELCLRIGGFSFNPHDLNKSLFIPDSQGWFTTNPQYLDHPLYNPSDACRNQRFQFSKAPGSIRIALVGGSTVWELGDASPLRDALAKTLHRPIEIINMGVLGCGSDRDLRSVQEALGLSVDAVVLYTGHNEFISNSNPNRFASPMFGQRLIVSHSRIVQLVWWLLDRTLESSPTGNAGIPKKAYTDSEKELVYAQFEQNVQSMVAACQNRGVPIVIATAASNLRMPTGTSRAVPKAEVERLVRDVQMSGNSPLALERRMAFYWGMLLADKLQRPQDAIPFLEQALLDHRRPERANRRTNAILKDTASRNDVLLVDVEAAVSAKASDGIPGFDLFRDNCHLTERGYAIVQEAIAMQVESLFTPRATIMP